MMLPRAPRHIAVLPFVRLGLLMPTAVLTECWLPQLLQCGASVVLDICLNAPDLVLELALGGFAWTS